MTTTTLADLAHTCRQKAAELLSDVWEWHGDNEPSVPPVAHDKAADWQALADLIDYAAYGTRGNQVVVAAKRLAARLDRAMTECPIRGDAWASITDAGVVRWERADAAIHVTVEFLAKAGSDARAFFEATYELGEWCPYQPDCRHARRKDRP